MSLFTQLTTFGDQIPLKQSINSENFVKWTEDNFEYQRYNPRKAINRFGLSITSLDGGVTGIPDLDSLREYNIENNTKYDETHFVTPTPVYNYSELALMCEPWKKYICRAHVLKLGSGGYFPPHRDFLNLNFRSFRLIVPLVNSLPPKVNFLLEDKILNWELGRLYFLNTAKTHSLFNASLENSYWIVFNIITNEDSVSQVVKNFNLK
jgi:hypothetical protein